MHHTSVLLHWKKLTKPLLPITVRLLGLVFVEALMLSVQYSTVQYSTVHYTTLQYTTLHYTTLHYSTLQYTTVQCRPVPYSTVQTSTVQYTTVQYRTVHYSTVAVEAAVYSQQPVDGHQQADVLRGKAHGREDEEHGHQPGTGNTGRSHAGQCGCHAEHQSRTRFHQDSSIISPPMLMKHSHRFHWIHSSTTTREYSVGHGNHETPSPGGFSV